ncbi:doubled CXXCH domain-containing protein [Thermodesulfovibrio aggregans]|uniref:Doubled CXXCH domain-containing protein n=1 Tax=Thermodesulfovibrio aggregans TaxID=86166 RepID=A0A0U9HM20_9BACT|nr:cytochrome c3 family protein [Thermodesulfovibrio aggregans]GAQ94059.1 doubled CXXCH domain-containing protein [Thermodesulfovibrio aggregans]
MRGILICGVIILCFLLSYFIPVKEAVSDDVKSCLRCHGMKSFQKKLENGETLSLYIDGAKFEKSVHGSLDCSSCHPDITLKNHPRPKKIADKRVYTKEFSKNCLTCHPQDALMKPKMHGQIVKKGEVLCAECHGSHYIDSMKDWKKKASFNEYCISCHKFNISKTLPSKEKISLKVNEDEIKKSVHGKFQCLVCHSDFSKVNHPVYDYKNKAEYRTKMTAICTKCHTDKELQKNPAHYALTKTASCIECHGYHGVKSAKVVKSLPENQYCLKCHSSSIVMKMKNGETLSVQVKENDILSSVHKKLKCTDCHKEFSRSEHPIRTFDSIKDYRTKAKDICNNCHQDAVKKYDISIHAEALKKGNQQSPDCVKCHDYHKVTYITKDKMASSELCIKCHSDSGKAFKESVHQQAIIQGKQNAPNCASCHNSHDVLPTNIAKLGDSCIKCHKDAKSTHTKWLWNPPLRLTTFVDAHFNSASCASCHTKAEKAIYLTLFDRANKKPLTNSEVAKIFGIDIKGVKAKIDYNNDETVQQDELWKFMSTVKAKSKANLSGRIDVLNPNDAHKIESKEKSIKDCSYCHSSGAQFKSKLEINQEGTKPIKLELDRKALNSAYAIPNIKDFYVLGLTKIKILDILFFVALLGGIAVPVGHITLRILTAPIRRKRKGGK